MFVTPDPAVEAALREAALRGNYTPYTHTEQDVIESVFGVRHDYSNRSSALGASRTAVALHLPSHVHSHELGCRDGAGEGVDAERHAGRAAAGEAAIETTALFMCDRHGVNHTLLSAPRARLACCPSVFRQPASAAARACRADGKGIDWSSARAANNVSASHGASGGHRVRAGRAEKRQHAR